MKRPFRIVLQTIPRAAADSPPQAKVMNNFLKSATVVRSRLRPQIAVRLAQCFRHTETALRMLRHEVGHQDPSHEEGQHFAGGCFPKDERAATASRQMPSVTRRTRGDSQILILGIEKANKVKNTADGKKCR